jgi:hypothetical protein
LKTRRKHRHSRKQVRFFIIYGRLITKNSGVFIAENKKEI